MKISVIEVRPCDDGGAELIIEVDQEYRLFVKRLLGVKRLTKKILSEYVKLSIQKYVER